MKIKCLFIMIVISTFITGCDSSEPHPKYTPINNYEITCIEGIEYIMTMGASKGLTPHIRQDGTIILCSDD